MKWLLLYHIPGIVAALEYASYYQDHMVLQRAPQRAVVWGYGSNIGDQVTVSVSGHEPVHTTIVKYANNTGGVWKVKLPPISDPGSFTITAFSPEGDIFIRDVLFGDLWMCSGQTDMAFTMSQVINSTYEMTKAAEFQQVRIFKPSTFQSTKPVDDIARTDLNWSLPSNDSLFDFSAVCWLFGEYLYPTTRHPVGLIQVTFPEASGHKKPESPIDSGHWNGMIYPLSQMVMYGVIWYQGTGNLEMSYDYGYDFVVMMSRIRSLYSLKTLNETKHNMPIGIVQADMETEIYARTPLVLIFKCIYPEIKMGLMRRGIPNDPIPFEGYKSFRPTVLSHRDIAHQQKKKERNKHLRPELGPVSKAKYASNAADFRWEQSFDYGVVPNGRQTNAFMAISMDITDASSPYGPDHPRYKQDVSRRLITGARNIAYGEKDIVFKGPYPNNITFVNNSTKWMRIHYTQEIDVRTSSGFQFCCSSTSSEKCYPTDKHIQAPIVSHDSWSVTLSYAGCGSDWLVGLTYAWSAVPCDGYKQCAVYSRDTELPAPPYINGWPWYTPPR